MHPFRACVLTTLAALGLAAATARADVITYDGSILPSASTTPPFSYAVFSNTGWSTDGNVLTMTTYPYQGIWFGKHASYMTVPWSLGNSAQGNEFAIRAAVANSQSTDWQVYMYDGTSYAQMSFFPDHVTFYTADASNTYISTDIPLDGLVFHNYSFLMKNGFIAYYVDGLPRATGYAIYAPTSQYLIIGDGSGSTYGTTGAFRIDSISVDTAPEGSPATVTAVPLPSAAASALAILPLLAIARLRRQPA